MVASVEYDKWFPLANSIPDVLEENVVYILPTRNGSKDADSAGAPRYTEHVRYLAKTARAAGLPVQFSLPEGKREFLQEYSIDPDIWALGLTCLTLANDWLLHTVQQYVLLRAELQRWTPEEALDLPLEISIYENETERSVQIKGAGKDVLEALRLEQEGRPRDHG
ncbi:hypothetical protein [Clavibacter capsici]|uniref:Uncharacterized protein n=1 Tax=Clavibacter capsici TaxID=1874630 RepID=A0AAE6XSA5_9MICO|nr:hypothetical protein [Clavibacter capsici]QIS45909.1 hypothetical protein GW570_12880 [Clavibacter capsici]